MSELITKDVVLDTLRRVVNEIGPDTRRSSTYVEVVYDGPNSPLVHTPSCIAAHVFAAWGVDMQVLHAFENDEVLEIADRGWSTLKDDLELTPAAATVLNTAQSTQDGGFPWAVALLDAEREARKWHTEWKNDEDEDEE